MRTRTLGVLAAGCDRAAAGLCAGWGVESLPASRIAATATIATSGIAAYSAARRSVNPPGAPVSTLSDPELTGTKASVRASATAPFAAIPGAG